MRNPRLLSAVLLAALALFTPHAASTRLQAAGPHLDLRRFHYVTPRLFTVVGAPSAGRLTGNGSLSRNWTGYGVLSSDNNNDSFTQVEGAWTVPTIDPQTRGNKAIMVWVGLGGDLVHNPQSTVLWQAGTQRLPVASCFWYKYQLSYDYYMRRWYYYYTPICARYASWDQGSMAPRIYLKGQYAFWYEDWDCTPGGVAPCPNNGWPVYLEQPAVHAGDEVYVKVNRDRGQVFFANLTTHEETTVTVGIDNTNTDLSAEWIAEETVDCHAPSYRCNYIDFGDPAFSSAYAYGSNMSTYVDIFNYRRYDLVDGHGSVLAQPPPLDSNTHGFSVTCCAR